MSINRIMKRKNRRMRAPRNSRRRAPSQPVAIVMSKDGGPMEADCHCPVCVDMIRRGITIMTMGPDGEPMPLPPRALPPMIEVVVRGTPSTWPELSPEARTVQVPAGCVVTDLLEYLRFGDSGLQIGFPPQGLWATLDGQPCDDQQVVRPGEVFRVSGERDPEWSAFARECMTPMST